jgi:hypothetical protein
VTVTPGGPDTAVDRHIPVVSGALTGVSRVVVAVAVALGVLAVSVVDPTVVTGRAGGGGLDKLAHAAGYAVLAAAVAWGGRVRGRALVVVALVVTAYGAGIELLQTTLSGRTADVADGLANAVGAVVGVVWYHLWTGR